ncbi:DUF4767 domain-containing protein [Enterococcus alishanensis]|uniref:DUF4767 domain-containing protein n=1 Tax=Enterococcus alishanensis TaxID=1303817 RepID=A0ABS6T9F3_9ENTE|nr:DUF4767 domain-containing protein [Enterococcus alishanensis]MBV7389525.1 DUF4767 domain-containing protein [Enterococcus alishanensis]
MKKIVVGLMLSVSLLGLSACRKTATTQNDEIQKQETFTTSSNSSEAKKVIEKSSSSTSATNSEEPENNVTKNIWDSEKADALRSFIVNWSATMGQSYQEYQPQNNVNFYGLQLPDDVLENTQKQPMAVDNQIVSAEWSGNGESAAEYSIVAVYSDADTAAFAAKHVYFFAIHNNDPVVLTSMQNQGMPDGAFHFSQTENQELKNGFQNIVNPS